MSFGPSVSGVVEGLLRQDLRLLLEALEAGTAETVLEYERAVQVLRYLHSMLIDRGCDALPSFNWLLAESEGSSTPAVESRTAGRSKASDGHAGRSSRRRAAGRVARHMARVITLDMLPNYVYDQGCGDLAYDGEFVLSERRTVNQQLEQGDALT